MLQYEALYQDLSNIELVYESKRLRDRLIINSLKNKKIYFHLICMTQVTKNTKSTKKSEELDELLKVIGS